MAPAVVAPVVVGAAVVAPAVVAPAVVAAAVVAAAVVVEAVVEAAVAKSLLQPSESQSHLCKCWNNKLIIEIQQRLRPTKQLSSSYNVDQSFLSV